MLFYGLEEQNLGQVSTSRVKDHFSVLLCGGRKLDASVPLMNDGSGSAAGVVMRAFNTRDAIPSCRRYSTRTVIVLIEPTAWALINPGLMNLLHRPSVNKPYV